MADYTYYKSALEGKPLPIHEDQPHAGYYRKRKGKGGPWELVRIQDVSGELKAIVGTKKDYEVVDPIELWTYCANNAVPQADAKHFYDTGTWPGDVDLPASIGDNSGDLSLMDEIQDYMETAAAWGRNGNLFSELKGIDKETADKAANYATHLGTLTSKLDKERKDKVAPHLEAQREVNGVYNPVIEEAKRVVKDLKKITGVWLRNEELKREKEIAATNIAREEVAKVKAGGQRGRRVGLRTVVKYEVTDADAVLRWAVQSKGVIEQMQAYAAQLAEAHMKNGHDVPGMKRVETKEAV